MEAILGLIGIWIAIVVGRALLSALFSTGKAAVKTTFGNGSFKDNIDLEFKGMGPFEIKLERDTSKDFVAYQIFARGIIPVTRKTNVAAVTSVFDETTGELEPVLCFLDQFQEPDTLAYQHQVQMGETPPDVGFPKWERIGVVLPEILQAPYSGSRKLKILVRLIDFNNPPKIRGGFHSEDKGIIWTSSITRTLTLEETGYLEVTEQEEEAKATAIQIAIAIAMADGELDESEGKIIQSWIRKNLEYVPDGRKEKVKQLYNGSLKVAFQKAKDGDLALSSLTKKLNDLDDTGIKYETLELCYDVMAADGVADTNELKTINTISEALKLDPKKIEKLRDTKLVGLSASTTHQSSVEDLLGIDSSWPADKTKKHLLGEFNKWNHRLSVIQDESERESAQKMLDLIAQARKKYG